MNSPLNPPSSTARLPEAEHEVVRTAREAQPAQPARPDVLADRRDAIDARFRWALTADEALVHRRLLNAGREAEARALVEQAERLYTTARQWLPLMNADELASFEQAVLADDAPHRYRVLAAAMRRVGREATWRDSEAPLLTACPDEDRDDAISGA
jgi:hypothetical protein